MEQALWDKPLSLAGVAQLAADVSAVASAIAGTLGFGSISADDARDIPGGGGGGVATAHGRQVRQFAEVDNVLGANPCLREVQVR